MAVRNTESVKCVMSFKSISGICWAKDAKLWVSMLYFSLFRDIWWLSALMHIFCRFNLRLRTVSLMRNFNCMSLSYYSRLSRYVMVTSRLSLDCRCCVLRLLLWVRFLILLSIRITSRFHRVVLLQRFRCIHDRYSARSESLWDTMPVSFIYLQSFTYIDRWLVILRSIANLGRWVSCLRYSVWRLNESVRVVS